MQGQDGTQWLVDQDKVERRPTSNVVIIAGRWQRFRTPQDVLDEHYARNDANRFTGEPLSLFGELKES